MHGFSRAAWLVLVLTTFHESYSEPQVYILAENLEQVMTSSTLQWKPYTERADILRNAVVAAHQIREIENVTENGESNMEKVPVYVCRAKNAALWVPGQFRKTDKVCIISLYKRVLEEQNFEILINTENRGRLTWLKKSKFTIMPQGSIDGGDKVYVARRSVNYHEKEGALTHFVGNFNPGENLGMFSLVDQNNKEIKYEDGEILVEQEPVRYEFKHIKFDKIKSKHKRHPRVLGTTVLKNEEEGVQRVDTVISYNYPQYINWGKEHGLLIALQFTANLPNGSAFTGDWSFPSSINQTETVPIERYLEEGTAVNVTLRGNYTESDIPYTTTVTAFYKDNSTLESILRDTLTMKYMTGVVIDFGPVYFLHNNTLVPTSTTTTRTTSKTTHVSQTQTIPVDMPNTDDIYVLDEKSEKPISNDVVPMDTPAPPAGNTDDNSVQQLTKKEDSNSGYRIILPPSLLISSFILIQIT